MQSRILIIDKRKELSIKYKRALEGETAEVVVAKSLDNAIKEIQNYEPDLIMVSDSIDDSLTTFCERIRSLTYNTRPVIVALSKSADMDDRIQTLESGADDFWSEPVNIEEFKTRINAHLRREIESNLDNKTLLPNRKISEKILKRILNTNDNNAVLLIGIENLEDYKSVYSDIAGDKLVQAFIAIVKSTMENTDFLGQLDENNFIVITNTYHAEKFAAFLTFAFDTVAPKFYNETDSKRGYMLIKGDKHAGMRAEFVSIQIGGLLEGFGLTESLEGLLERLFAIKKIAKTHSGSNYLIDRLKLTGIKTDLAADKITNIYIKEPDEALSLLLRTTLELQGYDVKDYSALGETLNPAIIILDSGDNMEELAECKKIRNDLNFCNSKIIVTATVHDKIAILDAGADLYLPKPYELSDLVKWVDYFFKKIY